MLKQSFPPVKEVSKYMIYMIALLLFTSSTCPGGLDPLANVSVTISANLGNSTWSNMTRGRFTPDTVLYMIRGWELELESQQPLIVGVSSCSSFRSCTASDWLRENVGLSLERFLLPDWFTHVSILTAVSSGMCWCHTDYLCDLVTPNQIHLEDSDVAVDMECN